MFSDSDIVKMFLLSTDFSGMTFSLFSQFTSSGLVFTNTAAFGFGAAVCYITTDARL